MHRIDRMIQDQEAQLKQCEEALRALKGREMRSLAGNVDTTQESIELFERLVQSHTKTIEWLREIRPK